MKKEENKLIPRIEYYDVINTFLIKSILGKIQFNDLYEKKFLIVINKHNINDVASRFIYEFDLSSFGRPRSIQIIKNKPLYLSGVNDTVFMFVYADDVALVEGLEFDYVFYPKQLSDFYMTIKAK